MNKRISKRGNEFGTGIPGSGTAAVLGYFMAKYKYPTSNMLLAFVLTPTIEKNFYRSLMVNNGSFSLYWTKPITVAFLLITVALMVAPTIMKKVRKNNPAAAAQVESDE